MRVTVEKADSDGTLVAGIANNKIVTKIYLLKQLLYYLQDGYNAHAQLPRLERYLTNRNPIVN